jgi:hypothetical protein
MTARRGPLTPDATWEFEAADPEVGFLSDTITHTCPANEEDAQPAEVADVHRWDVQDGTVVREQTVWRCPSCSATTTSVDDFPAWMFQDPDPTEEGE